MQRISLGTPLPNESAPYTRTNRTAAVWKHIVRTQNTTHTQHEPKHLRTKAARRHTKEELGS